ncbi:MAG: hypothetical protein VX262_07035 [Acidobacteriota bacterium]|nr:hypothetical protein [Acidobacteriota bacterium]|tara:strand:+ start:41 stop:322 length:282 start_codon:yes stop_codon:yes gene_type:complete
MLDASVVTGVAIQTLMGLLVSTGFLLILFVGFCVVAGFSKFRKISRTSLVHRNLVDQMDDQGGSVEYLPPDAPRGEADQLRTPELLEQSGNSS